MGLDPEVDYTSLPKASMDSVHWLLSTRTPKTPEDFDAVIALLDKVIEPLSDLRQLCNQSKK